MKVIGFMVDFEKIIKLWGLSIEFYGEWQKVATHHRTQYLKCQSLTIFKKSTISQCRQGLNNRRIPLRGHFLISCAFGWTDHVLCM